MTTRRLAAILATDVSGFSAMMERDEEGTAARIRALRADVIEPTLARHHGRLVKTTGDGFLAEAGRRWPSTTSLPDRSKLLTGLGSVSASNSET
jgi:class 3 adenylate cyclase